MVPPPTGPSPLPPGAPSRRLSPRTAASQRARHGPEPAPRPVIAAVDGSANGNRALEWAVSQALMTGAPLRIVHARRSMNTIGAQPCPGPSPSRAPTTTPY